MIRKYLFEIIDDIKKSENREEKFREYYKNRDFKLFIDITYDLNYTWEFDNTYKKVVRSNRENGGDATSWILACRRINSSLRINNNTSKDFLRLLDRALDTANQKDANLIISALKNRSIQYINTKKVYEWFPEFKEIENDTKE